METSNRLSCPNLLNIFWDDWDNGDDPDDHMETRLYHFIVTICPRVPDPQCGSGAKRTYLKWLLLSVAKVKKTTTYLLGSSFQE